MTANPTRAALVPRICGSDVCAKIHCAWHYSTLPLSETSVERFTKLLMALASPISFKMNFSAIV